MTAVTTTHPEAFRPALHYTARNTWLNDPNGLIYHQGLYHLYYQNNPFGNTWGNMSWGHATSENLTDWTEQPVAIACDEQEDIFSGSIVFDSQNSSGLGTETAPPLVAIYTSAYKAPRRCTASRRSHWPTVWTAASPGKNTLAIPYSAATRPTSVTPKFSATTAGPAPTG